MRNGKYYSLRPWHFINGASFSIEDFQEYQFRAQRWRRCMWIYAFMLCPPVWIILAFSIFVPRASRMKQAANRLGILKETKEALSRMEAGRTAYTPSQAQLDEWKAFDTKQRYLEAEKQAWKKSPARKKKLLKIWGIILLAMCAICLINGFTGNLQADEGESTLAPLIIGFLLFGGGGAWLLFSASKIKLEPTDNSLNMGYCVHCGTPIPHGAEFCSKCGTKVRKRIDRYSKGDQL